MGCAPCAQRAKERRERMLAELEHVAGIDPDTPREDPTYREIDSNSAYAEFKRKMGGYNSQALYPKNDQ